MSQVLESKPKAAEPKDARRKPAPASNVGPSSPLPLQTLLYLQTFAGNAAVAEMLGAATEKRGLPQQQEPLSPTAGSMAPPAAANGASPAAPAAAPAEAKAPGAMALLGDVTGVAMPVVGAAPMLGILGSLIGPAITPAGQQSASGGASAAGAATAGGAAKGGETATAGAVRRVDEKAASAGGAARADGAAKGGETSTAGDARPVDQSPAGAAGAARADGAAKGGEASTAGDARPVDQRSAGAAGQADGKGAEAAAATGAAPEAGPATAAPPSPETDPNFVAAKGRLHDRARQTAHHPPAGAKVAEAHSAAQGPPNDVASQAGAAQVGKMAGQQPGGFDKAAFMAAVRKAIDAAAPTTLSEADDFKDSGKAGQVKNQVSGLVGQNKESAEKGIKGATQAPPDTSAAQPKPVTPMPAEEAGAPPPAVGAASAMPTSRPAEESNLAKGPAEVNASMKEADVTEQQLKESNEPEFTGALEAKGEAEKHSAEAPKEFQQQEKAILDKGRSLATGVADQGLQAMHGQKVKALSGVASGKTDAKSKDEARRAEVSNKIEGIYSKTKDEVSTMLSGIDGQVDTAFKDGEERARAGFESYVDVRMTAYKDDRYSGLLGKGRWLKDKFMGMPDEVNEFYVKGRALYLQRMEGVISNVADIVGRELLKAKDRIALGKTQITEYVASLPVDLKKVGMEAQQSIQSKFDELTQAVDAKQEDVVNNLAKQYVESRDAVDARIKEMKEANKGLVDKAIGAIKGVIETILKLKDMLLNVLAKAAGVIGTIISAPIKFLGNLVEGIGQGLKQFMSNIGEHLKKGLLGWLFGALGEAGLTLPEKFDLKGILHIIMQILGLTYSHIRGLAVGIVGEEVVTHLEKSLEFFQVLIKEGPAGLWKWIVEKLSELKATVMDKIKEFIQEKVIIAGIMWLIGLLNPVAAFIKACKAIYDIVKFFIERASQVMELVNAILDSVGAIAGGALGEAAGKVEDALGKAIPVAIGFLASLLGLGGISDKIRSIIQAIQEPIHNVISKVLGVVLKPFKWIGNKIKQGAGWAKKKLEQGVSYVKDKAKAGVAFVKGKVAAGVAFIKEGLLGPKVPFQTSGESHEMWAESKHGDVVVMVASDDPKTARRLLEHYKNQCKALVKPELKPQDVSEVNGAIGDADRGLVVVADVESVSKEIREIVARKNPAEQPKLDALKKAKSALIPQIVDLVCKIDRVLFRMGPRSPALHGDVIIIDANAAIALEKSKANLPMQPNEQASVAKLRNMTSSMPRAEFRVSDVTVAEVKTFEITYVRIPLQVARDSQDYRNVLKFLEAKNVGGGKGVWDRMAVADALFSGDPGMTPRYATQDTGVLNRLAELKGENMKLGVILTQKYPDGFDVTISGRPLRVIPLPAK